MKKLKYLFVFILPLGVYLAFNRDGWGTFSPIIFTFVLIPFVEVFLKPNHKNFDQETMLMEKNSRFYDWILYFSVPIQILMLSSFLFVMDLTPIFSISYFGKIFSMGLLCGVLGINIGHELGHRSSKWDQFLGEILLLTSLNTHFLPYHNEGHHREVATPYDAATAKKDQSLFSFWITSHFGSYVKAWKIENNRLKTNGVNPFSFNNRMFVGYCRSLLITILAFLIGGWIGVLYFLICALLAKSFLETINYVEHYGLVREKGKRIQMRHSWNSNHVVGRLVLYELTRHSDHHFISSKKYQVLESIDESPQLPYGYPTSILLSMVPPLWFRIMNPRVESFQN